MYKILIKQPGDTLKQKVATNDFKMMGIARVEKYDLLENRVLKDFCIELKENAKIPLWVL